MDRAKAIRLLSIQYNAMKSKYLMDVECGEKPDREYEFYLDAFDMAITALREQKQREHGCKYCREYESIVEVNGDFISFDETISKGIFLEACTCDVVLEAKVPFCPMCGRKLGGADHD